MSLTKRGNTWWYEFTIDGQRHRGSTKVSNKEKARNYESKVRSAILDGRFEIKKQDPAPTFTEFYPELIQRLKNESEGTHPRTIANAEDLLKRISRFSPLAKAKLDQINDEMLSRFVTWHCSALTPNKKKYSAGSINKSLATVRAVLKLALEREKIGRCPKVSKYMLPEKSRTFVLTEAMRDEFLGGLPEPCRTVARFLLETGLRVSECCGLTWDRVILDESRSLMYLFIDKGKTENAERHIPLTPEARTIVEKQRTISRSNYVFVRFGNRVDKSLWYVAPLSRHTLSHQFMFRKREMGLPDDAVLHSTRHTCLTDLAASGADAFTIKEFAGHASVVTSEKYIHPMNDRIVAAMERFTENRQREKAASKPRLQVAAKPDSFAVPTNSPTVEFAKMAAACK